MEQSREWNENSRHDGNYQNENSYGRSANYNDGDEYESDNARGRGRNYAHDSYEQNNHNDYGMDGQSYGSSSSRGNAGADDRDTRNYGRTNYGYQNQQYSQRGSDSQRTGARDGGWGNENGHYGSRNTGRDWDNDRTGYGGDYGQSGSRYSTGQDAQYGRGYGRDGSQYGGNNFGGNRGWEDDRNNQGGNWRGSQYGSSGYGQGNRGSDNYNSQLGNDRGGWNSQQTGAGRTSQWGNDRTSEYDNNRTSQYGSQNNSSWDQGSDGRMKYADSNGISHKGKGPKGYRRSDDRIQEDINDRFTDDHRLDASQIEVKVSNGEVKLTGTVESRDAKRRAEDMAEAISGVSNVENSLRVQEEKDRTSTTTAGKSTQADKSSTTNAATSTTGNAENGSTEKNKKNSVTH